MSSRGGYVNEEENEYPPPSVAEVARRLKHDLSHLIRLFPEQCGIISQRYRNYRRTQSIERKQRVREEVRQVVLAIHAKGKYPSLRQVRALLSNSSLMRLPEAQAAWHSVLQDLGWEIR